MRIRENGFVFYYRNFWMLHDKFWYKIAVDFFARWLYNESTLVGAKKKTEGKK